MKKKISLCLAVMFLLALCACGQEPAAAALTEAWLPQAQADRPVTWFEFHVEDDITLAQVKLAEGDKEQWFSWKPGESGPAVTEDGDVVLPPAEGALTAGQTPALLNTVHGWVAEVLPDIKGDYWPAYLSTTGLHSFEFLEDAPTARYSLSAGALTKLESAPVFDESILGVLTVADPNIGMLGQVVIVA